MEIRNIGVTAYKAVYNTEKVKVKTSEDGKKRSYFLNNSQETDKVLNEKKLDTIQLSDEALKIIEKKRVSNKERFKLEIEIMMKLDHPYILKMYDYFEDAQKVYLIIEICTGGELFDKIV